MFQKVYLSLIFETYLFCLRMTGLWPFTYDIRLRRFKFISFYLVPPFILAPYIIGIYVMNVNVLLNAVTVLFKNIVMRIISNIYMSANVINFIFLYITQKSRTRKIQRLIYRTINFYENLCICVPLEDKYYFPYTIKFTIKSLVFAATIISYLIVSMTTIAPNVLNFYVLPGFVIPVFINKFYPDVYYGGMLFVDFCLLQINHDLKRILSLNAKNTGNSKEIIDMVDQLDTISINYIEMIEIVKEFNHIMSFRVVLWILLGVNNFLIHLFLQYAFIAIPVRYGHSLNIIIAASGIVDLSYQFFEFWLTSSACSSVKKKVEETEEILSSMLSSISI